MTLLTRRDVLQRLAVLVGGTLSLPVQAALLGQPGNPVPVPLLPDQQALIADLADVIIPTTNTPGAKAAGVGPFIEYVFSFHMTPPQQEPFQTGLTQTNTLSQTAFGKAFAQLDRAQQTMVVTQLTQTNKPFFLLMKELTLVGYFTSEIGATQALDYVPIPGRFEGDIPLKPGQRTWAI